MPCNAHGLDSAMNLRFSSSRTYSLDEPLVHPVGHHPGGRVVAEQVVDGGGHLERALVAVPPHRGHPPGIDDAGAEYAGGLLRQRAGAHRVGPGVVADVGGRRLPGQRPHGGDHAAVVLEVVIRVGDVVFAGVGVLGGHRDSAVLPVHVVGGRRAVEPAAVGEAAPCGVDLREVGVVAPVAAVDQLQQTRAVGSRFGAENPCGGTTLVAVLGDVGLRVGADVVVGGLARRGPRPVARRRRASSRHAGTRRGRTRRCARSRRCEACRVRPAESAPGSPPVATRRPRPAEHPAAQALRRCRHPRCASPTCPTPTARPIAASRRSPRGSGPAANPPSPHRFPTPAAKAPPWGRRSRSCARWAAR